jgi:hypothetical protein
VQLELLQGMGFTDRARLITMLEESGGDANAVVERLIS